eukprot:2794264-Pyramimonas_sp.AAC.1
MVYSWRPPRGGPSDLERQERASGPRGSGSQAVPYMQEVAQAHAEEVHTTPRMPHVFVIAP